LGEKPRLRSGFIPEQERKVRLQNEGADELMNKAMVMVVDEIFNMQATVFYVHSPVFFLTFDVCPLPHFSNKTTSSFPLLLLSAFYTHLSLSLFDIRPSSLQGSSDHG
jgi:hypothetical protein